MICQKYIARCYRLYQHERNENASYLSIFNGGGRPKWRFSNFPRFWKNSSALGSFNCIFENNSLKALFEQNMKKLEILKLSPDSRYLQKLALNMVFSTFILRYVESKFTLLTYLMANNTVITVISYCTKGLNNSKTKQKPIPTIHNKSI